MMRMPVESEVEFIFQKVGSNATIVLYGELEDVLSLPNATDGARADTTPPPTAYDGTGALMFVVAVIVVYSLSMFFIVATLLRRKSSKKSLDGQVNRYIKGLEAAREQDKMEQVLRTRLRWPGNFIRFAFESYSASDDAPAGRSPANSTGDSGGGNGDNLSTSSGSFIEMPATTLSLDHPNITSSFDRGCGENGTDEEEEDASKLPPVYAIPEFLRRNRRHRTRGDSGSHSRPASLCQTNSMDERAGQQLHSVVMHVVVQDDAALDNDVFAADHADQEAVVSKPCKRPNSMLFQHIPEPFSPLASFDPTPSSSASMTFSDVYA